MPEVWEGQRPRHFDMLLHPAASDGVHMLKVETIIERINERLKEQGTAIQSRQIRVLAEVMVEEINEELRAIHNWITAK